MTDISELFLFGKMFTENIVSWKHGAGEIWPYMNNIYFPHLFPNLYKLRPKHYKTELSQWGRDGERTTGSLIKQQILHA